MFLIEEIFLFMQKILFVIIGVTIMLLPLNGISIFEKHIRDMKTDFDPLDDIVVTVEIKAIRSLETKYLGRTIDKIDSHTNPDFYVKVFINGKEFISPIWHNQKYIYNPNWSASLNVPDDVEFVNVTIQLWDNNPLGDRLCDIDNNYNDFSKSYDLDLIYSIKTGHWFGDDGITPPDIKWRYPDLSGYGRANGCDDNSIYQNDRDCEMWFDIYQNDYDGDGIPYWVEKNVYHTDPTKDDRGEDADGDGIPIEWEFRWGYYIWKHWWDNKVEYELLYDPNKWDDYASLDPDNDGLNNIEEYETSQWGSNPFRPDLFVEVDQMSAGPNGEPASMLPDGTKEILTTAYNKHNIVYHLDDGCMGGGETIPFEEKVSGNKLRENYYDEYFLHNGEQQWRKGIFHYGLVVYDAGYPGYVIRRDEFQVSSKYVDDKCHQLFFVSPKIVYGSVFMHETGHTLDIWNPGVDDPNTMYPWKYDYWKYRPYKSCMNYRYTYILVDYSDGSHGRNDFDDWHDLSLTYFDG